MKMKILSLLTVFALVIFTACSKDNEAPTFTFTNNVTQGQANANGEYTLTGHITSVVNLNKVTLTVEGHQSPFLVDDTEAKNKNDYDFSYLITGITTNTKIIIDIYDQDGGKISGSFTILK